MSALPLLVTEDGVELVKAMVLVGPPLSAKEPRLSVATVLAQRGKDPSVTMLFAAVAPLIRTTVPPPA